MSKRFLAYLETHDTQILALLASIATLIGIIYLLAKPPLPNAGETVSWWGIARNLERGYGYSLCNQYYFPFCNSVTQAAEGNPGGGCLRTTG